MADLSRLEIFKSSLCQITNMIGTELEERLTCSNNKVNHIIWIIAIAFKVGREGKLERRSEYCFMSLDDDIHKDTLGFYITQRTLKIFRLSILRYIENIGVKNINIASNVQLNGFINTLERTYTLKLVQL